MQLFRNIDIHANINFSIQSFSFKYKYLKIRNCLQIQALVIIIFTSCDQI